MMKKILVMVLAISLVSVIVPTISQAADRSSWIENVKIGGDLRLRSEYTNTVKGNDNQRQRLRFRLMGDGKVNDEVSLLFGVATGSNDSPGSTNQDLGGEFQSKDWWMDYAYASYKPYNDITILAGKMKNPYKSSYLSWDGDIRPEGIAAKISSTILEDMNTSLLFTIGYYNIDQSNTATKNIDLVAPQLVAATKFDNDYKLSLALAYYQFSNYKGFSAGNVEEDRGGNNLSGGNFVSDFEVMNPMIMLDAPSITEDMDIPWGLVYEMLDNGGAKKDESGWRGGIRIGQAKLKEVNDWQVVFEVFRLEADAFPDFLPDGDVAKDGTDSKGSKFGITYQIAKNITCGFSYFDLEVISTKAERTLAQIDFVLKF